jgi:hypothetical protein
MSDRFRELAEELAFEMRFSSQVDREAILLPALRKLADEIREEDAKACDETSARLPRPDWRNGCVACGKAIRLRKTKPPSEVEPT